MAQKIADEFVAAYNAIDAYMKNALGDEYVIAQYNSNLAKMRNRKKVIKDNYSRLLWFGELRNMIVHGPKNGSSSIAIPTKRTLEEITQIMHNLVNIEKVVEVFNKNKPEVLFLKTKLTKALEYMKKEDYSQVIIKENSKYRILSREGIACWLQDNVKCSDLNLGKVAVADVLEYEPQQSCRYIRYDADVEEVVYLFREEKPRIMAILMSEFGRESDRPEGIITPWDLSMLP